jgi:large subunit ribosomal protein L9
MKNQLLLLEDVEGVGRKGEIVSVKPGFARNFLVPQKKGIRAEKHLVRLQERLQEERSRQAVVDRQESDAIAKRVSGVVLTIEVKVDAEKNMYGSVAAHDVVDLLKRILGSN